MPSQVYSRKNPFQARLTVNRPLTLPGSGKDTRHYELSLEGSGLVYECGDSMGVFCKNDPELVDDILRRLGFSGSEPVATGERPPEPVRDVLLRDCDLGLPDRKFLKAIVDRSSSAPLLASLLSPERRDDLMQFLRGQDVLDFLHQHPSTTFTPQEFVPTLRKLQPRLYSIASSRKAVGEAVHFTIGTVRYEIRKRLRKGVCSSWLAERVTPETPVPLFVHSAKGFRMPEDSSTAMIMVGPGTGVAPFRAFLQERKVCGASGKNWLFFGEQHAATDFLYGEELERYRADGILTRLDTAFSRDQAGKIYVQDRMREAAAELWHWIGGGAHVFVCGDASRMAKDVDEALHGILAEQGGLGREGAALYLEQMKKDKRYKRDVY